MYPFAYIIDIMKKKTILVTGGSGFIGRNICELLAPKLNILAPPHKELDLLDFGAVDNYVAKQYIDGIIHAANVGTYGQDIPHSFEKNIQIFVNLSRLASSSRKMITLGSGAEYDKRRPLVRIKESDFGKHIPVDSYGFAKYSCSLIARGNPYIAVLRLFGVFGKYEDREKRFISYAVNQAVKKQPIIINQNVAFDYLFINDLVNIIEYVLTHRMKHKEYNVGSGERMDLVSIAKKIVTVTGVEVPIQVRNKTLNKEYTCDVNRLNSELKKIMLTSIDDGIRELFQHFSLA